MDNLRQLVLAIHQTPHKAVLAITGGGAEAIGELLRYGGGSGTLIEAVVPYDQKAFDSFVKGSPDKYCSPGAARDLAMAAFQRAIKLTGIENADHLIGVGVSCSLGKDEERAGREHHAYLAVQTAECTDNYHINFTGWGLNRADEEAAVGKAIIEILAYACKIGTPPAYDWIFDNAPNSFSLITGQQKVQHVLQRSTDDTGRIIFAGAFNPLHDQHKRIAQVVYERTGKPVDLEVCVHNVDKPALNYTELRERRVQLLKYENEPWLGNIYFTALPTFLQKAQEFPKATFVVGWDTFKRISDPKYGDLQKVWETFKACGTTFMVFHRIVDGKSSHDEGTQGIYPPLLNIAHIISPDVLPPVECSSSEIRRKAK